jgi:hypothetical protein
MPGKGMREFFNGSADLGIPLFLVDSRFAKIGASNRANKQGSKTRVRLSIGPHA